MENPTPTFMDRMRARLARRLDNEDGLALLDVLIGMAIFALIAVIAVVALGQFRGRAFQQGAVSDANSLALVIESAATDTGEYPGALVGTLDAATNKETVAKDAPTTSGPDISHILTKNNSLAWYNFYPVSATNPTAYFDLCIEHASNGTADAFGHYDSSQGGMVAQADDAACPADPQP